MYHAYEYIKIKVIMSYVHTTTPTKIVKFCRYIHSLQAIM